MLLIAEELLTQMAKGQSIVMHWAGFGLLAGFANITGLVVFVAMSLMGLRHKPL